MRRSWFAGIVVPVLLGSALSGCATSQKRPVSSPMAQYEESPPTESGRRLFGGQLWSKPTAEPAMAHQETLAEPEASTSGGLPRGMQGGDPWPSQKSDRLSRYFPALGRRIPANPQGSAAFPASPTAKSETTRRDVGVRQAKAELSDTDADQVSSIRRSADDPPLLPAPIPVQTREHNRPAAPVQGGVDLGVSGASDSLIDSARGDAPASDRAATLLNANEPPAAAELPISGPPQAGQAASSKDAKSVQPAKNKVAESNKASGTANALPMPEMPKPSNPPTEVATQEPVPTFAPTDWPSAPDAKTARDEPKSTVAKKDEPVKPSTKTEAKASADAPTIAMVGKDEISSSTTPAPKTLEAVKTARLDSTPPVPAEAAPLAMPVRPDPSIQPEASPAGPTWTPTSQFVPVPETASGQSQSYFSGYGSPQQATAQRAATGHAWGLGLFSGKLLPCLQKKFHHKEATPTVYASPQTMFPPTYYATEQKAPVALPAPQKVHPAPQALPTPQASILVAKKKCEWLEKCKLIKAVKDWKAQCKIKMCPCCSGGHKSDKCVTATGLASPQASAPVSSPQTYADVAGPSGSRSSRPESRNLTERRDVIQRVSTHSLGESSER